MMVKYRPKMISPEGSVRHSNYDYDPLPLLILGEWVLFSSQPTLKAAFAGISIRFFWLRCYLRSDTAFPWAAFIKVIFLAACSILCLVGAAPAEASRENGGPQFSGNRGRHHTSIEFAKVRQAATSAKNRVRSASAQR